jgi:hypothetical protein
VEAVQYTFTHKQYTEHRERNKHNNKKTKNWKVRTMSRLYELYLSVLPTFIAIIWTKFRTRCPQIMLPIPGEFHNYIKDMLVLF